MIRTVEQQRAERRRRWRRVLAYSAAALPVAVLLGGVALTYHPRYAAVPATAWRAPALASRLADDAEAYRQYVESQDPRVRAPEALAREARAWVRAINTSNLGAILFADVDSFGNLYVVMSAQWLDLPAAAQPEVLKNLTFAWRSHLRRAFGDWDSSQGFAPGIVLFDASGPYARFVNDSLTIDRQPIF